MSKNLYSNIQPAKQAIRPLKGNDILQEKPRIGQRRAGKRRRRLPSINQAIAQSAVPSKKISEASKIEKKIINHPGFTTPVQSINNPSMAVITRRPMIKNIPFYPDPIYIPPPKPVGISTSESPENINISLEFNVDFKENSPFQEGIISETYQGQMNHFSRTSIIGRSSQYRQANTEVST